ncbi:methyl-accepting chemotaxis protein [Ktedonospora formicarum]|uniref:Methyl-accepting chemotaxis protein n=1 Tax=Ktedonospora formicarum TaxID=2778364 RepID=A0A8J3HZU6_9CHLR|nr:methyl-accepting chemotaxis protein [Ktedonospora formicarum]GHO42964.1 hypothetical protein KSX_11270 [Ktedonospora formicarum]
MNPDRNKGMTVDGIMQTSMIVSALVPLIAFAVLGGLSLQMSGGALIGLIIGCAVVVVLLVLIVNYLMQRRVKDRVQGLIEACREYANGDRSARVAVNGDDDFAVLGMSINSLLEHQSPTPNAALGSGGSDAAALQAQIEKLLQEVSAVGDGDLRVQAEVTPDTLGVLADSFNYMIEELAKVVGRVQSTAVQVTNATRRILDGSNELTQASETQVAQISQTTEAVEALAVFIQSVAKNAQTSVDVSQQALRNATNGQQAVRQTIEGMMLIRENVQETAKKIKRLGERSNEIGEIVRIIEDIADQTNLLALNAAIQSAMAGEHGRGFAVVADEIRLLAERSTESTKRIATLVKSIQGDTYEAVVAMEDSTQEVVKGSQLADNVERSLNSIYADVERQAQMIESIAHAANEQTSVSEAVAVAMGRISEITRQTDSNTQEAAVSVSYLAELAEQLRASVSTFRLPDHASEVAGGTFPGMASIAELPSGNNNSLDSFGLPSLAAPGGNDGEWNSNQSFAGSFPPLPEPNNESLIALGSRSNAQSMSSQQGFGDQFGSFGGQNDQFGSFGGQNDQFGSFGDQGDQFGGFGGQNDQFGGFGGQNDQFGSLGSQQGFANLDGADSFQGMNSGFGLPQNSLPGIGAPNPNGFSMPPNTPLGPVSQPGFPGQPGTRQPQQQRWPGEKSSDQPPFQR